MFEEIREKRGLAYAVSTNIRKHKESGAFLVHCGLNAKNLGLAFKVILTELKKIRKASIPKAELSRAKDYILGNLAMGLESTLSSMFYIGESLCSRDEVMDYAVIEERIQRITSADLKAIASRVFLPDKLKVAIVTDRKESYARDLKTIVRRYA